MNVCYPATDNYTVRLGAILWLGVILNWAILEWEEKGQRSKNLQSYQECVWPGLQKRPGKYFQSLDRLTHQWDGSPLSPNQEVNTW